MVTEGVCCVSEIRGAVYDIYMGKGTVNPRFEKVNIVFAVEAICGEKAVVEGL